jgi:hypothetical protein
MFRHGYERFWENVVKGKGGKEREDEVERTIRNARKSSEGQDGGPEGGDGRSDDQQGQDQGSSRRGSGAGRPRRRYPDRRASGSDDGGEGKGGNGEVRVQRTKESENYEKEAYSRWYPAFIKYENDASEKLARILNERDQQKAQTYIPAFMNSVNEMSMCMKNIYEEYAGMFFNSLPGGITKYYIRKHLFNGLSEYMRMYVLTNEAITTPPSRVREQIIQDVRTSYEMNWKSPTAQEEEGPPAPAPEPIPRSRYSGRRRTPLAPSFRGARYASRTRKGGAPESRDEDVDSDGGGPELAPESDEIEYPPSPGREPQSREEEAREGGIDMIRRKGREAAMDMYRKIRRAGSFNIPGMRRNRPSQPSDAEAFAGATPHTPRIRARAARRLEKMGYYKAEGSFLATPFSLDVLPVLESATSVHGGQPAAQVAAEQQAEGHRRVPVPPVGAGDL